jgi:hypothetical protein
LVRTPQNYIRVKRKNGRAGVVAHHVPHTTLLPRQEPGSDKMSTGASDERKTVGRFPLADVDVGRGSSVPKEHSGEGRHLRKRFHRLMPARARHQPPPHKNWLSLPGSLTRSGICS